MIDNVEIEKLSNEGRGLAFTDRPCFVLGGLPGETMSVRVLKKYKGILDSVAASEPENASEHRVAADCQHFLQCGGCYLQHMDYAYQVDFKNARFKDLWQKYEYPQPKWCTPITANSFGYRRKARISVRWVEKKQKLLFGFKEQDSRKILDMQHCKILTNKIEHGIFSLQTVISSMPEKQKIPQIEVVEAETGVVAVIRNLVELSAESCQALQEFSQKLSWDIWLQPKGNDSVFPINSTSRYLSYSIPKHNLKLLFKPLDFIQVNANVNLELIDLVIDWLDLQANDSVLDLFCGLGNFSLPIAQKVAKVTGVEGSEEMVVRASSNAVAAGLADKTSFFAHDLRLCPLKTDWISGSYNKILLDPPRSGAKACISWILDKKPGKIVYVSCNPESLVNDIKLIIESGYRPEKACIADMFPHTKHIESVVCFSKE